MSHEHGRANARCPDRPRPGQSEVVNAGNPTYPTNVTGYCQTVRFLIPQQSAPLSRGGAFARRESAIPKSAIRNPRSSPAFTLVELLVTIAIIGILVAVLVPALAGSKNLAKKARELAAAHQLSLAYTMYAEAHRGTLMPGYATPAMTAATPAPGQSTLAVFDEEGQPITGVVAQRYPWRLHPYLDSNFAGIYLDPNLLARYRSRLDFIYVASLSPSMGLNSTFCGGDADRYGFAPAAIRNWGPIYVTNLSQPQFPSRLIVFASARGVDPDSGDNAPVQGYFRVDSPYLIDRRWIPQFDASQPPGTSGHIDLRYQRTGITTTFDGHAQALAEPELSDMRRWSDQATRPDWTLGSGL